MNKIKEERIVLTLNGKGEGSVLIECTRVQAASMTYALMQTLREKSRDEYEGVMEKLIREDLVGEDEETKDFFNMLLGGE